jgi:hypothetical protein
MTLTIDRTEFRPERADQQPTSIERWVEVMYGTRPDRVLRRTFVPMTSRHPAGVVDWLRTMWGLTGE